MEKKSPKVLFLTIFNIIGVFVAYLFLQNNEFQKNCYNKLRETSEDKEAIINLCQKVEEKFFKSKEAIQELLPSTVGAPELPIDDKVKFVTFHNPYHLSSLAYCYFAFRGWFDPTQINPIQISHTATGFAILRSELNGYKEWLGTDKGISCSSQIKKETGLDVTDLDETMADNISIIAFNPIGAINIDKSLKDIINESILTMNHERIHAIHVTCPNVDNQAVSFWNSLSDEKKNELALKHPSYNWKDLTVAIREAYAFHLENNPEEVLKYTSTCNI